MRYLTFILILIFLWGCDTLTDNEDDNPPDGGIFEPVPQCIYESPQWCGDGSKIAYYTNYSEDGKNGIYLVDTTGNNNILHISSNNTFMRNLSWSGDGEWFATVGSSGQVVIFDYDGHNFKTITNESTYDFLHFPALSYKGDKIVFRHRVTNVNFHDQGFLKIFSKVSDNTKTIFTEDYNGGFWKISYPNIAKNGLIAATLHRASVENIYILSEDGEILQQITFFDDDSGAINRDPKISPDNAKLLYTTSVNGYDSNDKLIYVVPVIMDISTGDTTRLANYYSEEGDWSPDGTKVVFRDHRRNNLVIVDTQGNELRRFDPFKNKKNQ